MTSKWALSSGAAGANAYVTGLPVEGEAAQNTLFDPLPQCGNDGALPRRQQRVMHSSTFAAAWSVSCPTT
jgi:hypothetical protein